MRRFLTIAMVVVLLMGGAAFAQEEGGEGEGRGRRDRGFGPGMRGGGAGMGGMMEMFKMFRALRSISEELDVDQRAKLEEATQVMMDRIKEAQKEFEADLAAFLTAVQMEKFKEVKEAPFERGMGRRGREGEERRPGGERRGGEGRERPRGANDPQQMLQSMDTNGDRRISRDEFKGADVLFERIDADKDGHLTAQELEILRSAPGGRDSAPQ